MFGRNGRKYAVQIGIGLLVVALLVLTSVQSTKPEAQVTLSMGGPLAPAGGPTSVRGQTASVDGQPKAVPGATNGVQVGHSSKNDVSPPLRSMTPLVSHPGLPRESEDRNEKIPIFGHQDVTDPVVQRSHRTSSLAPLAVPVAGVNFAGISSTGSGCGCAPPDTNGDVSPTQYVQTVNSAFQVWNKSGGSLYGPANINTIWSGFGGPCQTNNDGDPVVLYDAIGGRWLISQFTASSPYNECIAISQTGDATGAWNRYAFQLSTSDFPDYPKLGVWPDGYYMSVNKFTGGSTYAGPQPYVFNRTQMMAGQSATFQTFPALGANASPLMPADLDGSTLPPSGAPNYFVEYGSNLSVYKFHVNWTTPSSSTFTNSANLTPAGFTQLCASTQNCIPQKGTTQKVDGLGDRLMFRLAYRNFGTYETMVVNHSVDAGSGHAGVRWYEIRNPGGTASIYQQGTYAPDSNSRWMGSVAMDQAGDIAVGYSVSSSTLYPSIRYASRVPGDTLGTLSNETSILAGTGYQAQVNRWGDYSDMTVDPADDCTFWYTQEVNSSGGFGWSTRIGSFKFATCSGTSSTPTATSVPTKTNTPVPGSTSTATSTPTKTSVPSATPTSGTKTEQIVNGGFENGKSPWAESSTGGYEIIDTTRPHTGSYSAYLCGYNNCTDKIYQTITVPANATLSYWWNISTTETSHPYDYLKVQVYNTSGTLLATLRTWSDGSLQNSWSQDSISLATYAGQTVRIQFTGTNDVSNPTDFFVDDVSVK